MLRSACEAANILAYNIGGGSIQNFLDEMNAKAAELGCTDTHFSNAHGLFHKTVYSMEMLFFASGFFSSFLGRVTVSTPLSYFALMASSSVSPM